MRTDVKRKKTGHSPIQTGSEQKKKKKLNPKRFTVAMLAIFFVLYFICVMIGQQIDISKKNKEIDALEEKIAAAQQQTEKLEKELENLNDPEYLEEMAREKLGLVRPNERVFVDVNRGDANQGN